LFRIPNREGQFIMVSEALTHQIRVQVKSSFVPDRSDPGRRQFIYQYRIRITNEGGRPAQLISRHWIITDGFGKVEEVKGPGVVGEQPLIAPGETFEYTSFCPLPTQYGVMQGTYQMVDENGGTFEVEIAPFRLFIPPLNN